MIEEIILKPGTIVEGIFLPPDGKIGHYAYLENGALIDGIGPWFLGNTIKYKGYIQEDGKTVKIMKMWMDYEKMKNMP